MHKTDLNLTVFSRALASFKAALAEYNKDDSNTYVRDSVIQRFEYCYDLSKKMLIRHLKNIGEDNIDSQSLADIIRLGAKKIYCVIAGIFGVNTERIAMQPRMAIMNTLQLASCLNLMIFP